MELRHLRYFLAVGEALKFTKAAAQLRVAQPALSRQVQDLEDEIGVVCPASFHGSKPADTTSWSPAWWIAARRRSSELPWPAMLLRFEFPNLP